MSDNDLIRRGDVMDTAHSWVGYTWTDFAMYAISAIPAATPTLADALAALDGDAVARIRADAMRDAADELYSWGDIYGDNAAQTVLALIDKESSHDRT